METCVLIPSEFSLVLRPRESNIVPLPNGFKLNHKSPKESIYEMDVCVWSNQHIKKGSCFLPFQGTIRLDRLEVYSLLDDNDVRNRFGCFDEIQEVDDQRVRHCNWIRFLRYSDSINDNVNLIGRIVRGEVIYETIKNVGPNTELIVYYDYKKLNDSYATLYPSLLASTPLMRNHNHHTFICRQTLQDSPLDLSMSLVTSPSSGSLSSSSSSSSSPKENRKPIDNNSLSLDLSKSSSSASVSLKSSILNNTINSIKSKLVNVTTGNRNHNDEHVPISYGSDGTPSPVNVKSSVTPLIVKKPRERTMLPCEYCGKAFDRPSLLRRHLRTHTGEKPHVCDVCGKGFSTSSSLNTHRRIHSGEKPHQCPVCGKRFTASSNLYYHRMTHNKVKPHACQLCSKSFPTPGDLKSHMYVHNGSWPFKCHICNRGFSKQTNLRNHMYLHSGDRPHECEVCQKRFALACNLRAHLKTHEEPQSEKCQRCGREFPTATGLVTFGCCHECYHNSHGIPLLRHKQ